MMSGFFNWRESIIGSEAEIYRQRIKRSLDGEDVTGRRTFLAIFNGKFDFLAFVQGFKTAALDSGKVYKHIFATVVRGDETKAFRLIKPFY